MRSLAPWFAPYDACFLDASRQWALGVPRRAPGGVRVVTPVGFGHYLIYSFRPACRVSQLVHSVRLKTAHD